jgi:hypothetical protein
MKVCGADPDLIARLRRKGPVYPPRSRAPDEGIADFCPNEALNIVCQRSRLAPCNDIDRGFGLELVLDDSIILGQSKLVTASFC